jgi:two-component system, cell cycle sensor histidine kinase and response regulator CckA
VTILVVEDDPAVLTLVDRLLTAKGHSVLAAHDPDDASFVLAEHGKPPDLLLTDIILPGTTGVEYAQTMKAGYPTLRVIFMTGWAHRAPSALRAGIGPVLRKPFTAKELYDALEG